MTTTTMLAMAMALSMLCPWKGVAGIAVVVDAVVIDKLGGHAERVVQRDRDVRDLRGGVLVVHVKDSD